MLHVLLVCEKLIPSALLCGHAQLTYLAEQGKIEYRQAITGQTDRKLLSWANVIVFIRSAREPDYYAARAASAAGKKLVYVLDDDLLNVPEHIASSAFYNSPETQRYMRGIMGFCDCFASPSLTLLEKYGGQFRETARIEEPAIPHEFTAQKSEKIRICFAGSLDRTKDIETLLDSVLNRILDEYGDKVSVTFFGARPAIVDRRHLNYMKYRDSYTDYIAAMGEQNFDIGLSPMLPTEFSECKHYNKYIEYAAHGIVGIYSNVIPYSRAVNNMENGILCENTEEAWYQALKILIDDADLRNRLKENCIREAETIFSLETVANAFYDAVCQCDEAKTGGTVKEYKLHKPFYRLRSFILRCFRFAKRKIKGILSLLIKQGK